MTATVSDASGLMATDSILIVRDLTPPRVEIYHPIDGSAVSSPTVSVHGLVNDIVAGTVNATEATVRVNGIAAQVANRSFLLADLPLVAGSNVIEVLAVDEGGNETLRAITVERSPSALPRLVKFGGDLQTGVADAELADPLVVHAVDVTGQPVPGVPVLFRVTGNDGSLPGDARRAAVITDAAGEARTTLRLGSRAGLGDLDEASALGFVPTTLPATTFVGTVLTGEPSLIVVDSGGNQEGIAGRPLPRPLIAVVTDAGFNRLGGVPVVFRVVEGGGSLGNGLAEDVVVTDSDGRAIVELSLDSEEGIANNVVLARIAALPEGPLASFTASGKAAGTPEETSISGVVLDNTSLPIEGTTIRIRDTSLVAVTGASGQFKIAPAPVGTFDLIVDGSTVQRPGAWPDLEFEMTTIPGRDNDLNMPIYLLPLDLAYGVPISETTGGTVHLPSMPGFALEIAPGSATFPGGGKSGVISVTLVHNDRVPMVPNFGQQPRLIVTVQPPNVRFEPPARLTLPNVDGLAPDRVSEMYSFDHDLGHFVSIGPATVSADGLVLRSNPGVGIVKSGWHCGGDPGPTGIVHKCPVCQDCDPRDGRCRPLPDGSRECTEDNLPSCRINPRCVGGRCTGDRVTVSDLQGPCTAAPGDQLTYTVQSNAPHKLTWSAPGFDPTTLSGTTTYTGELTSTTDTGIVVGCSGGARASKHLNVRERCGDREPELVYTEVGPIVEDLPGLFGLVHPGRYGVNLLPCSQHQLACWQLFELHVTASWSIDDDMGGKTILDSVDDLESIPITSTTCRRIMRDFTRSAPDSRFPHILRPPFYEFISRESVLVHERKHLETDKAEIYQRTLDQAAPDIQGAFCSECPRQEPAFDEVDVIVQNHAEAAQEEHTQDGMHEETAYAAGEAFLAPLRQAIRAELEARGYNCEFP